MSTLITALYARVASRKQDQDGTIASQINVMQKYAAAQGWTATMLYTDEGYSGTTLQRPALDQLLLDARAGRLARVVVLDPDRLSREANCMRGLADELARYGVPIVYAAYRPDDSDEGTFMDQALTWVTRYERAKILSRTRRVVKPPPADYQTPEGEEPIDG